MLKYLLISLSVLLSANCWSTNKNSVNFDRIAKIYFEDQNYEQAVQYFEKSFFEGNTGFTTRYNLAVSYFKLGKFTIAKEHFLSLITDNFGTPSVVYSLAVTEKTLGNIASAIKYFSLVKESNSKLTMSAVQQLALLGVSEDVSLSIKINAEINGEIGVSVGHNDALIDIKDDRVIRSGDSYIEFIGALSWSDFLGENSNWDIDGFLYNSKYSTYDQQDFSLLSVGITKGVKFRGVELFGKIAFEGSQLGNEGYMRNSILSVGLQKNNHLNAWKLKYRFKKSDSLNDIYEPYAGDEHQIQAEYHVALFGDTRHHLRVKTTIESIDRPTTRNRYFIQGLSKDRGRLDLSYQTKVINNIDLTIGVNITESRVDNYRQYNNNVLLDREESAYTYYVKAQKQIFDSWMLTVNYNSRDNESNLENFDFEQAILKLGVSMNF